MAGGQVFKEKYYYLTLESPDDVKLCITARQNAEDYLKHACDDHHHNHNHNHSTTNTNQKVTIVDRTNDEILAIRN